MDLLNIYYDDEDSLKGGKTTGIEWLKKFHRAAVDTLGFECYFFSHAPQAKYFSPNWAGVGGGYIALLKDVDATTDFYFIRYYAQNSTAFDDYDPLFVKSDGEATKTAV